MQGGVKGPLWLQCEGRGRRRRQSSVLCYCNGPVCVEEAGGMGAAAPTCRDVPETEPAGLGDGFGWGLSSKRGVWRQHLPKGGRLGQKLLSGKDSIIKISVAPSGGHVQEVGLFRSPEGSVQDCHQQEEGPETQGREGRGHRERGAGCDSEAQRACLQELPRGRCPLGLRLTRSRTSPELVPTAPAPRSGGSAGELRAALKLQLSCWTGVVRSVCGCDRAGP